MNITTDQIQNYRLRVHHLDQKIPITDITDAAGACGLQNSPPGAWETALFNRLEGCTLSVLQDALYREKSLLQAWSFRGAPVVFPTAQSDVFLAPMTAQDGEQPWIYTMGITAGLDYVQMSFDDVLRRTRKAAGYLDSHTIRSKELLDQTLADLIEKELPEVKKSLWRAPSMYGSPDKQTVGGAVVSFLLRPCSFSSLVVFGERQGNSPTFTSFQNWIGHPPEKVPDADRELVRKFLHCYGPATETSFQEWLGCSRQQAHRLWLTAAEEMEPVTAGGKSCYLLHADRELLLSPDQCENRLILLGAHDPYLDIRDRSVLLEDKTLQKAVWKTVANPGAVIKDGRIAGIWKSKTQKYRLDISISLFEPFSGSEQKKLTELAEEYAGFRQLGLHKCGIE